MTYDPSRFGRYASSALHSQAIESLPFPEWREAIERVPEAHRQAVRAYLRRQWRQFKAMGFKMPDGRAM